MASCCSLNSLGDNSDSRAKGAPVKGKAAHGGHPRQECAPAKKTAAAAPVISAARPGSKKAQVVAMLQRKNGATLAEKRRRTSWARRCQTTPADRLQQAQPSLLFGAEELRPDCHAARLMRRERRKDGGARPKTRAHLAPFLCAIVCHRFRGRRRAKCASTIDSTAAVYGLPNRLRSRSSPSAKRR
jgi:hypothetical protein